MLLKHSFFINKKQLALFSSASQRRSLISISLFNPSKSRKNIFFDGVIAVMLMLFCEVGWGQSQTFDTPGTYTFTVPTGVTSITISAWGSGAGGDNYNARGGGGGAFAGGTYTVTPGTQYTVTVGAGAGAGTGDNGQSSSFGTLVVAVGAVGRNGGAANSCTGQIRRAGGNGGQSKQNDDYAGSGGGGSGGSGGNGGNGGNADFFTPGAAGVAGGGTPTGAIGGTGGNWDSNGVNGSFPGGGGGERGDYGTQSGGGGDGQVIVSWTSILTPPSTTGAVVCVGNTTTLSASGAINGDVYLWYSAATGGTLLKTSTSYTDNTFTTPILYATTNYWVSIRRSGQVSARTQVTASYPYPPSDSRTSAGTNSWIGHIYDGVDLNNYLGNYTQTETFREGYGSTGTWPGLSNDDVSCFNVYSYGSLFGSVRVETFSAEYRMNSTRRGLFYATFTSDDGSRLYVDGNLAYQDWQQQAPQANTNVLFSLSGNSSLILQYYENTGQNVMGFDNLTLILSNTLNTNINQSVCLGSSGSAIGGDVFGTLPTGISLSGTGYQWAYSTSPSGTWNDIFGATSATYTPSTVIAPFNSAGTYYIIRKAILSSTNNYLSPTTGTYTATNESNAATITVNALPTAGAPSSNPTLCINTALTAITHTTTGATGIGAATGLPAGVTAAWASASNTITISGTPLESATFDYSIPLTGGCGTVYATGTITVNPTPVVNNYSAYSFCSGEPANIGLKATPSSTFLWSRGDITGIFVNPQPVVGGTSNTIEQTLSIPNNATTGSVEYLVTPTSTTGSCVGAPFSITVTVEHPAIGSFE